MVYQRVQTESAPFAVALEELHRDLVVLGQLRESFAEGLRDSSADSNPSVDPRIRGQNE